MGMLYQCDGCGKDIGEMDRTTVRSDTIEEGSIQLDLCMACAAPVAKIPAYKSKREKNLAKIEANKKASEFHPGNQSPTAN